MDIRRLNKRLMHVLHSLVDQSKECGLRDFRSLLPSNVFVLSWRNSWYATWSTRVIYREGRLTWPQAQISNWLSENKKETYVSMHVDATIRWYKAFPCIFLSSKGIGKKIFKLLKNDLLLFDLPWTRQNLNLGSKIGRLDSHHPTL